MSLSLTAVPRARRSRPRLGVLALRATELVLRPERFFRFSLRHHAEVSTPFLLIWLVGVNGALDSIAARATLAEAAGRAGLAMSPEWTRVWPMALVGGILSGLLAWWVRGWWFRVRLRFCGAVDPSLDAARLVWLYATSVYALPSLALTVVATPFFADLDALMTTNAIPLTSVGLMFWAIWVGYRGAVSCFTLGRVRAVVWFLVVPGTWFLVQFGAVILASLALR